MSRSDSCCMSFARVIENVPVIGHLVALCHACRKRSDRAERAGLKATIGIFCCLCNFPAEAIDEASRKVSPKLVSHALTSRPAWMKRYHNRALRQLCIPGSHQSCSFNVDKMKRIPMSQGWGKCQNIDISNQLKGGIRFLDLRIMTHTDKHGTDIWTHHNVVACVRLRDTLATVREFITDYPSEIVFVYLTSDGKPVDWGTVRAYINEYFHDRLIFEHMKELLISDILDQGKNVVVAGVPDVAYSWRGIQYRWPNRQWPYELKEDMEDIMADLNNSRPNTFYWYKAELTPGKQAIMRGVGGVVGMAARRKADEKFDFLDDAAAAANHVVFEILVNAERLPFNVLSTDFVQDEIVDRIIEFNEKMGEEVVYSISPNQTNETMRSVVSLYTDGNTTTDSVFMDAVNVSIRSSDGTRIRSVLSTSFEDDTTFDMPARKIPPVEIKETNI